MLKELIAFSALGLLALTVEASQLLRLDVSQHADIYEVHVEMEFDAPAENIRALLTDYNNLDRLNASITSSEIIDAQRQDALAVRTRIRNCVLLFCMNVQKVEHVSEDAQGRIITVIDPARSNFRSGHGYWEVRRIGSRTRVVHHARLEPDLWIPPWMGTAILKDTLRRELRESFENLDCLANDRCENGRHADRSFDWEEFTRI